MTTVPFYYLGFMEHEIAHAMGRTDYAFAGTPPILTPLDFFKYDPGTVGTANPALDPAFVKTTFSIDGGATAAGEGRTFSNTSDSSDWIGATNDPYNYLANGATLLSNADLIEMEALGWDPVVATPEPGTWLLLGAGLVGLGGWRRRRAKQQHRPNVSVGR